MINDDHKEGWRSFRPLFPDLSEEELKEVEDAFYGYLETAWEIFQAIEADPVRYAKFEEWIAEEKELGNLGFSGASSSPLGG